MTFTNSMLCALGPDIVHRLHLAPVTLELHREIESSGKPVRFVHFLEHGVASMTTTFADGSQVEIGTFGYESAIGITALLGSQLSPSRIYMQIAGNGYRCSVEHARQEFDRGEAFHVLTLRFLQAQLAQAGQSAGCNAKHSADQRLARWLLTCADRAHSLSFVMSHEHMARMLGARRTTVTVAAIALKSAGLISYNRGKIVILDPAGLEQKSCECYRILKNRAEAFTAFDRSLVA